MLAVLTLAQKAGLVLAGPPLVFIAVLAFLCWYKAGDEERLEKMHRDAEEKRPSRRPETLTNPERRTD